VSRHVHICVSVRSLLNWTKRETKRNLTSITKLDGTPFSGVEEFRNMLMDELAEGHEVLPIGYACEGFDYKKGCPGHEIEAAREAAK